MKGIIQFSLNNKFAIWIMTLIVTFAGLYSGLTMKKETMPNLNFPYLTVNVIYPGAAPEAVVNQITEPLELQLRNLEGVKNTISTSMENVSTILLEYNYGQDIDRAANALNEAIDRVKLPDGAQKATVSKFSFNSFPIISLSVSGDQALEELTKITESDILPDLEGIPGVASVQISGQYVKEAQLTFHKEKMASLGLDENTVKGIIQGSALKVPLGLFEMDQSEKTIVVDGRITTLEDLKNVEIPLIPKQSAPTPAMMTGQNPMSQVPVPTGIPTIKLGEIASIELVGKAETISRTNGEESIGIQIVKANDANTVEVVDAVKDEIKKLEAKFTNTKITVMMDQGKPINESVRTMLDKALFGALFAVVIILLFLRNIRTTIISVISIPLSLIIGILILHQLGVTLNIMTLGAMTVAIGRVVDDSIVVIENIYRRLSLKNEPLKGKELIREATHEMFIPISSSTIVTIAVFLPLSLVSGMVGELFMPFALTIVFSLLASLLVAITIVPMLGHSMFKNGLKRNRSHKERAGLLVGIYQSILNWALNHKIITFGGAILLLVGSLFLTPLIGASFLPDQQDKYIMITYNPDPGKRLEDVEKLMLDAEKIILNRPDVTKMQYSIGGGNPMMPSTSKSALFFAEYDKDTKNFAEEKKNLILALKDAVPSGEWNDMENMSGFGGNKLTIGVYGDSLEQIKPIVDQVFELVQKDTSFEKAETNLSKTYEQYTLVADQKKLSSLGLTAGQLAMVLSPVRERPVLTNVEVDGKTYKVYIEGDKKEFKTITDIENTLIQSPLGIQVPIKEVAKVEKGTSPNSITRKNGQMVVEVNANFVTSDIGKASKELEQKVDQIKVPNGVDVKFGGVIEQMNDTFTQLGLAMAAAVAIVYLILVITFGGGLAPFAILFSLPFATIGGLVALYIAGETISVSAMMGALMLIGIVVTNAIVLIDRVIHKEKEGLSTRKALLEAGATRLRPILMTALATIGALLPLAFGLEGAGIISRGLGVTVIGGLISSTLLTLVIVPIVYEFLMKFRRRPKLEVKEVQ